MGYFERFGAGHLRAVDSNQGKDETKVRVHDRAGNRTNNKADNNGPKNVNHIKST
jgi:hypothetical protein